MPDLSFQELRARWKALFGNPAPLSLRRRFLAHAIAYQMQVNAYGGLSASAKRRLQQIAAAVRRGDLDVAGIASRIRPGAQLIRQWRDQTHTVTATKDGFEWKGRIFKSLSAIARQITVRIGMATPSSESSGFHQVTRTLPAPDRSPEWRREQVN